MKSVRFWSIGLVALIALGGMMAYAIVAKLSHDASSTTSSSAHVNKVQTVTPRSVMLELPGTQPITALHENYDDPSSTWVVVSKDHPLTASDYVPNDLVKPSIATNQSKSTEEQSLRRLIVPAATEMFTAAKQAGYDLMVASGYRSYALQKTYFDNYARTDGVEAANKYSALPGQSEHQTGLSFDISYTDRHCYLETCFGETEAGKWLAMHAVEYGFILRYPADKTAVTKYQYEPWHFRYVGKDLARALTDSKLTLDEAYPYLQTVLSELKAQKTIN